MNVRRMMGVAALGAAATSLAFVPGAGAQSPPEYAGTSAGEALSLSVLGQKLTVGSTATEIDSSPKASASGAGFATPIFSAGATTAAVQGTGTQGSTEPTCEAPIEQIPGISIGLACGSAFATVGADGPSASATGTVGEIVINPVEQLLATPLAEVLGPVEGGLDQLLGALAPVLGPIDDASGLGLDDTLQELVDNLFSGADLVSITLGANESSTSAAGGVVTSECSSDGIQIDVLGAEALGVPPVISIVLGEASTSVTADRNGGEPTAVANPSLATIRSPLVPNGELPLSIGQTIELPLPEPLGTTVISAAAGTRGVDENGLTFATAGAFTLELLNGEALQGGIQLDIAGCTSAAGAVVPAAVTPPQTPTAAAPTLPTTGSDDTNTLALAGVVGLAGLGLALLRRSGTSA